MRERYKNLEQVGTMLSRTGVGLRYVAFGIVVIGVLLGIWVRTQGGIAGGSWVLLVSGSLCFALGVWVLGIIVRAIGESLFALVDIATNSWATGSTPPSEPSNILLKKSSIPETGPSADQPTAVPEPAFFELAGTMFCSKCRLAVPAGASHSCKA